ncbi:hypothetical protein PMAYCL1PPCAC_28097, partial [Pristionchus mayeri]
VSLRMEFSSPLEEVDIFHWNLSRSFQGISSLCALIGIVFNSCIFITTVRSRKLRATYNILIAICALSDVVHQIGTLVQLPFVFGVYLEIDSRICDVIMFIPEMGIGVGCACILSVGIDRMLSVVYSLRYRALNNKCYHANTDFRSKKIRGLTNTRFDFSPVYCEIMTPYGMGGSFFATANFSVNIVSSIIYFITWIGLQKHADAIAMKRIIKSLFIIVTVDVSGWLLTPGLIALSKQLNIEPQQQYVMVYFGVIFINLALSIKLPIYYFTR